MRLRIDISLSIGKDEEQETNDRYEDATGTHHTPGPIAGFDYTRPEDK